MGNKINLFKNCNKELTFDITTGAQTFSSNACGGSTNCVTSAYLFFECNVPKITFAPQVDNDAEECFGTKGGINYALSTVEVKHNGISLFTTTIDTSANNGSFEYDNGGQFNFDLIDWGSTGNIELQYNLVYNDSSIENVSITGSYDANVLCPAQLYDCWTLDDKMLFEPDPNQFSNIITDVRIDGVSVIGSFSPIKYVDELQAFLLAQTNIAGISKNLATQPNIFINLSSLANSITSIELETNEPNVHNFTITSEDNTTPCATDFTESYRCWFKSEYTDNEFCPNWVQTIQGVIIDGTYYPFSSPVNNDTDFANEMTALNIGYQNHNYQYTTDGALAIVLNSKNAQNTVELYNNGYVYPDPDGIIPLDENGTPPFPSLSNSNCFALVPCP